MSKPMSFWDAVKNRRSIYAVNDKLPISDNRVVELVNQTILNSPSSFNSQSTRVLVLLGPEHERFWDIVKDSLIETIGEEKYNSGTNKKIDGFKAGYGSILFFEDEEVVRELQKKFEGTSFEQKFPQWSEHASAIHQYVLWTALSQEGVGVSLQHYNPLPDERVKKIYSLPASWAMKGHLNLGGVVQPAGEKTFEPLEKRVVVPSRPTIVRKSSHRV